MLRIGSISAEPSNPTKYSQFVGNACRTSGENNGEPNKPQPSRSGLRALWGGHEIEEKTTAYIQHEDFSNSFVNIKPTISVPIDTTDWSPGEEPPIHVKVLLEGRIELTLSGADPSLSSPAFQLIYPSGVASTPRIWATRPDGTGHVKVTEMAGPGPFYLNKTVHVDTWTLRQTKPLYEASEVEVITRAGETTSLHVGLVAN